MILCGKQISIVIASILLCTHICAQSNVDLSFAIKNQIVAATDNAWKLNDTSTYTIKIAKFYISKIQFWAHHKQVYIDSSKGHLINLDKEAKINFTTPIENYDSMSFLLGLDSITNAVAVRYGDLNPINGMYWAWKTGYIHFKLEGEVKIKNVSTEFQYHLGGYLPNEASAITIGLACKTSSSTKICIDMKTIISKLPINTLPHLMTPGAEAQSLIKIVAASFQIE
jgi:hypothetical protein